MRVPIKETYREVSQKSDATIERETSRKWLARAIACYQKFDRTGKNKWLIRAESYRQEALEHAALIGDCGKTVCAVEKALKAECAKSKSETKSKSKHGRY